MGYYADIFGELTTHSDKEAKLVVDLLKASELYDDVWAESSDVFTEDRGRKYREENYPQIYQVISPYLCPGSNFECIGEEGEHWKHVFEGGQWVEYESELRWINPHPFA